jgi:hypothetical protein
MFTSDSLPRREAKLAIAWLIALLLALTLLLAVSARPAHACVRLPPPPGTDSFAAASWLDVGYDDTVHLDGDHSSSTSCSTPQGITTPGNTSGATMEVGEPRPYSSIKDCGIFGVSNSVWWKVTVPFHLPSRLYGTTGGAYLKLFTGGSSFDTVMAVYQGSSLTSLRQVTCSNDNSLPNWNDRLYAGALQRGQTYYGQLSGTGGARSGSYSLNSTWMSPSEYARATKL